MEAAAVEGSSSRKLMSTSWTSVWDWGGGRAGPRAGPMTGPNSGPLVGAGAGAGAWVVDGSF